MQDSKKLALNPFFQDKGTVEFCVLSEEFVSTNTDKNCLWKTNPVNLSLRNIDIYQANSLPLTISIRLSILFPSGIMSFFIIGKKLSKVRFKRRAFHVSNIVQIY